MAKVTMSGLDKLNRRLMQIPKEVQKEIKAAMEIGAQTIVDVAKSLAPLGKSSGVDSSNNPGALRDSIGWVWGDKAPRGSIKLGSVKGPINDKDLVITIFAGNDEAFYARWVEFGTNAHGINAVNSPSMRRGGVNFGTHVDHPGAIQHAFFFPAYRSNKQRVKARVSRAVNKAVKKVVNS